ncbi:MAG TPA: tetratricopeptide repeat protein [Candidatus Saccharimonas sp.]|jgi:tetratricopeptide (TPR) repeat protein|nr:tetratricopeptide repeat protein [Candidatus Saccharibacteria bacterium]MCA9336737.1 tetratricopeptide repeat protein [Candidatus Saccharibacteria bacterium]HPQ82620.1 tetratricopeptide repeat protein [Candidatus Saccharimonas sp.]
MFGLLLVSIVSAWAIWRSESIDETVNDLSQKVSVKLDKLWDIAQDSLKERKYLRAEKALLTILRVDEKNATAYNRLGILYAKQQAYSDAIECFEIAQSLEPSASSLHNVGLIYYETGHYDKAALAFEQALGIEDTHASRHIAYAKVQEKLGNTKQMIASLEKAVEIDPSVQSYHILADAYERAGETEKATELREQVNKELASKNPPTRQVQQVRKVQM